MSNEHPFMSPGNNEPEHDPFARLDLFEHDPRFAQVLSEIEKLQQSYAGTPNEYITELLAELNSRLFAIDWIGDKVEVTGKLRVAPWSQNNSFENAYFKQAGIVIGEDEQGLYCNANELSLVMALVDVDEDGDDDKEAGETGRYIFTFHTPDAFIDIQDDPDELYELKTTAGDFIMYPDELELMKFSTPSLEQIERTLELYYPTVNKEITRSIRAGTGRYGSQLLRDLQAFSLPPQRNELDPETYGQIGRYIYDRAAIDPESDYRFITNGPIKGMSIESGLVESRLTGEHRLNGTVIALDFDPETSQLLFVVSELSSVGEGYELRLIPVEAVNKLQCIRPLQSSFGAIAMKNFDSSDDIREYWSTERTAKTRNDSTEQDDLFSSIESLFDAVKDDYVYNERGNFYELSLDEDINSLIEQYVDHLRATLELHGNSSESAHISELLMKDIERLNDIALEDDIATKHKAIFIEPQATSADGTVDVSINVLEGSQRLKGTFAALTIAQFPSEAMIQSEGSIREFKPGLGMVLRSASIFEDSALEDEAEPCENEVIVMIAPSVGTKFVKIKEGPTA